MDFAELIGAWSFPFIKAPMEGYQGSAMAIAYAMGGLGVPCAMLRPGGVGDADGARGRFAQEQHNLSNVKFSFVTRHLKRPRARSSVRKLLQP